MEFNSGFKGLNGFRPLVDITSNTFYKCTATFRSHCMLRYLSIIWVARLFEYHVY